MADRSPIPQADPGQPNVAAATILNGARRNESLDLIAGSSICVAPCECPRGIIRACTPNHDPNAVPDETPLGESESFDFLPFDWHALDVDEIAQCIGASDMRTRLDETINLGAAYMLGQELDSAPLTANPSLQSEGQLLPNVPSPVHPADAVAMLLQASAQIGQSRNTFIAADHALPAFMNSGLATQVNGQWRLAGRPLLLSPGISGDGPGGVAAAGGSAYLWMIKGSVDYNWSPVNLDEYDLAGEVLAPRLNQIWGQAIASGIVRFNPMCTFAVPMCLKHESCCQ